MRASLGGVYRRDARGVFPTLSVAWDVGSELGHYFKVSVNAPPVGHAILRGGGIVRVVHHRVPSPYAQAITASGGARGDVRPWQGARRPGRLSDDSGRDR